MTFLKHLVYRDERLERLDFVGKDRLAKRRRDRVSLCMKAIKDTNRQAYTFMPAQKALDDL